MLKTNMEYRTNTLFVNIEGSINKKDFLKIRNKIYYIIDEYSIKKVVIDLTRTDKVDNVALNKLKDEYNLTYGGILEIIGN